MSRSHPDADGIMALVHQGLTQAANGKDTTANTRDMAQALRASGIPSGAVIADLIDPGPQR